MQNRTSRNSIFLVFFLDKYNALHDPHNLASAASDPSLTSEDSPYIYDIVKHTCDVKSIARNAELDFPVHVYIMFSSSLFQVRLF